MALPLAVSTSVVQFLGFCCLLGEKIADVSQPTAVFLI